MVAAASILLLVGCTSETKKSSGPAGTIKVPRGLTGATCSKATSQVLHAHLLVYLEYAETSSGAPCTVTAASPKGTTVTLTISDTDPFKAPTTTTTTAPPWYPAGYTAYSYTDEIAWRWMPKGTYRCDSGSSCWGVEVVAHYGCSGVYAEVSVVDSADRVIDYANDSIGAVRAGQHGILKPSFYSDGGSHTGRLASLTCN